MSFRTYLETRYVTACKLQQDISRDPQMVAMLQGETHDAKLVYSWMREYGLFQGINANDRDAIVDRFLRFVREHKRYGQEPNADEIEKLFLELFTALHENVQRSWMSATSKLLWCLYPNTIVIYDAFVYRVLAVLQCIEGDLEGFQRIGEPPQIKNKKDIVDATKHYMNYQAMVRKLLISHGELLHDLRARHSEKYLYDVRIMDKVLWMIGNLKKDYPAQV